MNDLNVAVVQPQIVDADVETNLGHYAELLTSLSHSTDLILLPEMFPTGYSIQKECLEPHLGPSVEWMRSMAQRYNALVGGTVAVTEAGKNYNRFYLVEPEGTTNYYDKQHLFVLAGEENVFSPGNKQLIVSFRGWRIAVQTCFDLRFPEGARNKGEYDLLLYAAAWPAVRNFAWQHLLIARAIENQTYLAASNRVGTDSKGSAYVGNSVILDAEGGVLSQLDAGNEGIMTTTLNRAYLVRLRTNFPFLGR